MKNAWIVLLVLLVAAGAFFLGRRSGEALEAAPAAASLPASAVPAPVPTGESSQPSDPVRTFRGPDGRAHIISYDEKNPPDSNDPEQVRKALLSDMKNYPRNIELNYDLSADDVEAMLAGTKTIPEYMLPQPQAAAR